MNPHLPTESINRVIKAPLLKGTVTIPQINKAVSKIIERDPTVLELEPQQVRYRPVLVSPLEPSIPATKIRAAVRAVIVGSYGGIKNGTPNGNEYKSPRSTKFQTKVDKT